MTSQQVKWFVTKTLNQLCIFHYFSGFLNRKNVFDNTFKDKNLNSTSFLLKKKNSQWETRTPAHIYVHSIYNIYVSSHALL